MISPEENLDPGKAIATLLNGEPLTFRFPGVFDVRFSHFSGLLSRILGELDLSFIHELLLVVLKELVSNCVKAHAKRLFFKESNLDIEQPDHYRRGIRLYSTEVLGAWDAFVKEHKDSSFFISIAFQLTDDSLLLSVQNSAQLQPQEVERIQNRIAIFQNYRDMEQAFSEIKDESEGAGLGIVLSLMLLSRAGIPADHFQIHSSRNSTTVSLRIPRNLTPNETKVKFREVILNEIHELPSFPENIAKLIHLCNSDTSSVKSIAQEIQKDPALTAQIFKMVNSAGYINRFQNPTLADAVKIIGIKVIRNLLMVSGARSVIHSRYRYKELENIWETSNRVSFFARQLSKTRPAIQDHATVAGLLFDLGRIVLITMHPHLVRKINELIARGRLKNSWPIEEVELGISHPEIGALLAEKWNFPLPLIVAIRYQQKPLQAPGEFEELVQTIYMAIRIQEATQEGSGYHTVENDILSKFNIFSQEQFLEMVQKMDKAYRLIGESIL